MTHKTQNGVINPFSDEFIPTWQLWKEYRKEEHNFQYRGCISEQMAFKRLVMVSEGDEQKAQRIVEQSISRGWMDFYELKQPNPNGKSAKKSADTKSRKQQPASYRDSVQEAINQRYGNPKPSGESNGSEPYLKAV